MKIKKAYIYAGVLIILALAAVFFYFRYNEGQTKIDEKSEVKPWYVDENGYLYYPLDRGAVKFRSDNYTETGSLTVKKIVYESNKGNIYGLLALPNNIEAPLPGVVLLPGAGVSKESELPLAEMIAGLGAAVLTIDQRGVGETDGPFPSLDEDYASFLNGQEPYQHLMVYDALRAFDLLKSAPFIDADRIIIAGESLGGRIAVIAAATDRNINGVLVISSSGFGLSEGNDTKKDLFIKSIDSDHYIGLIAPRKIVMIHNLNDPIIPANSAINSYSKAQQPKEFILINDTGCNHGYCDSMYDGVAESLDYLVG